MNIHDWKVVFDGTVLGQVLNFTKSLDQTKITSKAIDGTVYIQTVGAPTHLAAVTVFSSPEEMYLLNAAEAAGTLINVTYRDVVYKGYVESKPQWQATYPGKWYTGSITLLIEEEVT